jgi:hypothetical protein
VESTDSIESFTKLRWCTTNEPAPPFTRSTLLTEVESDGDSRLRPVLPEEPAEQVYVRAGAVVGHELPAKVSPEREPDGHDVTKPAEGRPLAT